MLSLVDEADVLDGVFVGAEKLFLGVEKLFLGGDEFGRLWL